MPTTTRTSAAIFVVALVCAVTLDLVTKSVVFLLLDPAVRLTVVPGLLNLKVSRNPGAVFGIGQRMTGFFIFFTFVACAGILWVLWVYGRHSRLLSAGLGALFGGAVGNLWDRIAYGSVRDFIDLHIGRYHWPTFNVADMAICFGSGVIIYLVLRGRRCF